VEFVNRAFTAVMAAALVALHVAGAVVVWIAAVRVVLATRAPEGPSATGPLASRTAPPAVADEATLTRRG
jgi:hypothetical protein